MNKLLLAALLLGATYQSAKAQSRENMIGCWTMHGTQGTESLSLTRNDRFTFNDWNKKRGDFETLTGKWSFSRNGEVTLWYNDRSKQSFQIVREAPGKWMLTKAGGFRLRKADPSECSAK